MYICMYVCMYACMYANKILTLRLITHQRFRLSESACFPYEMRLQRSSKFDIVTAVLNSTQQPYCFVVTLFRARDFR